MCSTYYKKIYSYKYKGSLFDVYYIRYPIYHIPMGRTIKDLSTCFLTYHTLSSSFQGALSVHFFQLLLKSLSLSLVKIIIIITRMLENYFCVKNNNVQLLASNSKWYVLVLLMFILYADVDPEDDIESPERKRKEGEGISLPPFGLATYKMQGNVWVSGNCGRDQERLVSLLSVADSWLKQLRVQHHDFNYFTGIRRG